MLDVKIVEANPADPAHAGAIVDLLDTYAGSQSGGGQPLTAATREKLPAALAARPTAHVLLAYANGRPAGLLISFEGFSTFQCRPLLNIHDLIVEESFRGRGLSKQLLAAAESLARRLGCCKLTLEVLEGNTIAQAAYRSCGFQGYELDPAFGKALFWERKLTPP
ncbi:MAG: GNAT family N-acetyltransferase [Verrucomicrobiaceae bacterium]|nr:MAG: GNAT family N-acetyltransferase [Verrucomicrobiaceae bacterium]